VAGTGGEPLGAVKAAPSVQEPAAHNGDHLASNHRMRLAYRNLEPGILWPESRPRDATLVPTTAAVA
jgi:hypothetical protein